MTDQNDDKPTVVTSKEEFEQAIKDNPGDLVAVRFLHDETDSRDRAPEVRRDGGRCGASDAGEDL